MFFFRILVRSNMCFYLCSTATSSKSCSSNPRQFQCIALHCLHDGVTACSLASINRHIQHNCVYNHSICVFCGCCGYILTSMRSLAGHANVKDFHWQTIFTTFFIALRCHVCETHNVKRSQIVKRHYIFIHKNIYCRPYDVLHFFLGA